MSEVVLETQVQETSTEVPALAIAAAASIVLVCGLAFAVQEEQPAASIALAGWVALSSAVVAGLGLLIVSMRRLPRRPVQVSAAPGKLTITGRTVRFRSAFALLRGDAPAVEVERATSTLRFAAPDAATAERLAAALSGQAAPVALLRFRLRADYLRFLVTIWAWLAVYGALCVIPPAPIAGVLLTLALLPVAAMVTLRAIPGTLVVTPAGVWELRAGSQRFHTASAIQAVRVRDDLHVLLHTSAGEEVLLGELHEHPREPQPATTAPPAARLEACLSEVLRSAASPAAR
jgi:hypothetical protein